ncbi:HepT-like ribonuclease domain-containing protein [Blastomonas sp.]|uniref:HepT-like ribonuclease domain-containing protein n=1 Tax=Blastomonas sp. TaxID=1909299 RepID=UPI00260D452C|nr:HepT-like ribonuclease domain-containing protein [Blastomonas sp.]MDM7956164.1 DUF86 domain-containing protein [Blastomonas sp.]
MSSNREHDRLQDIIENAEFVADYLADMTLQQFSASRMTVDAIERCLQRITEAVIRIGEERIATIAPDVPFHALRGLGNRLRHEYDMVDHEIIYAAAKNDVPQLAECCRAALDT